MKKLWLHKPGWASVLCFFNREQDKVISLQIDAIKKDKRGVKSLTALTVLLNLISYGIDSEGDAVLYSL